MFTIRPVAARNLVEIVFEGEYGRKHSLFHATLMEAVEAAQSDAGAFDILVDMTEAPVMPQDRLGPSSDIIKWGFANGLRRGAFVNSMIVGNMQMRRLFQGNDQMQYFKTRDEAERWLDS